MEASSFLIASLSYMRRALFRETGRIIPGTTERIVEGIFLAVGLTYIVLLVCHTGNYYIHLFLSFLFLSCLCASQITLTLVSLLCLIKSSPPFKGF